MPTCIDRLITPTYSQSQTKGLADEDMITMMHTLGPTMD
jgi:hypothetical protein